MTEETKYSVSKTGKQCIGPCYEANKPIVHPYTLEYIVSNKPFCPVAAYKKHDDKTGKDEFYYFDDCYESKVNKDVDYDNQINILIPEIEFSCSQFLKLYYKITTFDEFLTWITQNKANIRTKFRLMNCALKVYGSQLEIIDDRFVTFFVAIITKLWINDIYKIINRYIKIQETEPPGNKVSLYSKTPVKNTIIYEDIDVDEDPKKNIKLQFIIDKFANKNIAFNFLNKYILPTQYDGDIKLSYLRFILNKIDKTIS